MAWGRGPVTSPLCRPGGPIAGPVFWAELKAGRNQAGRGLWSGVYPEDSSLCCRIGNFPLKTQPEREALPHGPSAVSAPAASRAAAGARSLRRPVSAACLQMQHPGQLGNRQCGSSKTQLGSGEVNEPHVSSRRGSEARRPGSCSPLPGLCGLFLHLITSPQCARLRVLQSYLQKKD